MAGPGIAAVIVSAFFATAVAATEPDASALMARSIDFYQGAKTVRAHGRAVAAVERAGKLELWDLEDVEISFDRAKGVRATTRIINRSGMTMDVAAWGPIDAIQLYREDRDFGFLSHVETRKPNEGGGDFTHFGSMQYAVNPVWVLMDPLLPGHFNNTTWGTWAFEKTAGAATLIHRTGDELRPRERRYRLGPDGRILSVSGRETDADYKTVLRIAARFDQQSFGGPIPIEALRYTPPTYGPVFDIRGPLTPEQKIEGLRRLAAEGDHDAQIRMLPGETFDPASTVSKAEQFQQAVTQLQQAEAFGFGFAYAFHAQLVQPDNRSWFPAELEKLSDSEIRHLQREILFDGARNCSAESAEALLSNTAQPVSADEKRHLIEYAEACNKKRIPSEIAQLQKRLDEGATLEDLLK